VSLPSNLRQKKGPRVSNWQTKQGGDTKKAFKENPFSPSPSKLERR
jgi:hypothetical protein